MYTHADPVNNTDPTGHYTLSGLSTALNIRGILTVASRTHAGMSWMDTIINGDPANFDAKALGAQVILSLLGGKVAEKFLGMVSRKFRKACNSFEEGTLVHTESGLVPIEEIEIGDLVWAYNEETGKKSLQEVVHLIQSKGEKDTVDITLNTDEVIHTTAEHPFYVVNEKNRWVSARDLVALDKLLGVNGEIFEVAFVRQVKKLDIEVFNLTVEGDHTFYAGLDGVLNHNTSCELISAKGFSSRLSKQRQDRHVKGTKEWERKKGGYLNSQADAQEILDSVHSGKARVLGKKSNGDLLVEYRGVQGFNNSPANGFIDQPTHRFFIKKGDPTSVVPTSPTKVADILSE